MFLGHHFKRVLFSAIAILGIVGLLRLPSSVMAQDQDAAVDPAALALYADAANFQTNGAIDLAIASWQQFLEKFPDSTLRPKVAHYLGVCYMQSDPPQLIDAAKSFGVALQSEKYELREESLFNRGWCFYAAAIGDEKADKGLLGESLATFQQLFDENPQSSYRDRAYFYSGEAAYSMGNAKQSIEYYSKFLQLNGIEKSPLHCDALYAHGIAQEETGDTAAAAKSFEQLLAACVESDLVVDVQLRLGDIRLAEKEFEKAIPLFQKVIDDSTGLATDEDRAHALFRQGYCFARLNRSDEAAARYERLVEKYPDSQYAVTASLAAGQARYRSDDMPAAEAEFRRVLEGNNASAATEAAHWLARIELAKAAAATPGSEDARTAATAAYDIAAKQIAQGTQGDYAVSLRLDAAEALSFQKEKLNEALKAFQEVANEHPNSPLAPRAIYNAAFTALQLGNHEQAITMADNFQRRFRSDSLFPDVAFIGAEAKLISGEPAAAAEEYQSLLSEAKYRDNPQRVQWILRAATAFNAAGQPAGAAKLIAAELDSIENPSHRAEAFLLAGQAQLKSGDAATAAISFRASREADPKWARSGEALLLAGQAQMQAGNAADAIEIWKELISSEPQTRVADQARYKLAQLFSSNGDYTAAIEQFDPVIASGRDSALLPFAMYGKGWAEMSAGDYQAASTTLGQTIEKFGSHAIYDDALLAHGITQRNLEKYDDAAATLTRFLETDPDGLLRGHGLYELALVRQRQNLPEQAAANLSDLVKRVPDYPGMDKVVYELGWSLKEAGQEDRAIEQFQKLVTQYPENPMVREAAYYVGQKQYGDEQWTEAAKSFEIAARPAEPDGAVSSDSDDSGGDTSDDELLEKSLYRLGWSHFKAGEFAAAEAAFVRQFREAVDGPLFLDAMMMVGESRFAQGNFETALRAYLMAREKIQADNDSAQTLRDDAERQVRELTLLHGGQSAAQLKKWEEAIGWYDELRNRFPATTYLPQVFYETGFAHQQAGNEDQALKLFGQVADNYRNELAARARFMMGEIHFANKSYPQAISDFQRVMYGFGAEQAPQEIKNWQAKSGFEAGRCGESLVDIAKTDSAKTKSRGYAVKFYEYVVNKHPAHELAAKAKQRLDALQ